MKLDPRIKKLSDILTCVDIEEAKQYINQIGYFADNINLFDNLDERLYGVLAGITVNNQSFCAHDGVSYWRYFIPECRLKPKEKKYRPYTMENFTISEFVIFREKSNPSMEYHVRYNGYRKYDNVYKVILGNISYTFSGLFEDFERLDNNGKWVPFGVEE